MNQGRPPRWKSPWLWIGLSCGVLALGALGLVALMSFSLFKYREVKDRIRDEPVLLTAEMIALHDQDVTLVSRDTERHTLTLRNRKTGESFLLEQVEKDKLRIRTDQGEVVPDFSRPSVTWSLRLGSAAGPMPSWVPVPPGPKPHPLYALKTGEVLSGSSILYPSGPAEDVLDFYRGELERKGFELVPGDSLSASTPDYRSSVFVTPTEQKGRSGLLLTWSQMTGNP